jgi:protease IV
MALKISLNRTSLVVSLFAVLLLCGGCIKPKITIFPDNTEPLQEFTLQGSGKEKILIVSIKGFISDSRRGFPIPSRTSMVEEIVSQLKKAEKDKEIKAIILKIDSPGGSVTASDILYHEIMEYKKCSGAKIVAAMMGVAASGGYYVALPADFILAHPTTITGSIGVVFLRPNVSGLMNKIGLEVQTNKSGKNKDMGSPFRKATREEEQLFQNLIDDLAGRFLSLAESHRKLNAQAKEDISSARVYIAADALNLGLVDQIGYLDDAIRSAAKLAGLPEDTKVVVYRRTEFPNDNIYNTSSTGKQGLPEISLIDLGLADSIPPLRNGFYYLWLPEQAE